MNSSQLLNALNKQSHKKHQSKNKSSVLQSIIENNQSSQQKENQFSEIKLPQKLPPPPQFLVEILKQQQNSKLVKKLTEQAISKVRKQRQKNVFLAFNQSHLAYLSQLKTLSAVNNQYASNSIEDVMLRRFNMVAGDLQNGKLIINRDRALSTKEQVQYFEDLDRARLVKIKEGVIRSKLDLLNVKMEQMEKVYEGPKNSESIESINRKIEENLDLANYGLESEKTKIAKDYVKYMSEQRRERRKREKLRQERQHKIDQQREAELKQASQMKDLSKKQQILQRIEQSRKKRQQQQNQIMQKEQRIEKFLEKYREQMPIFKKKQKQFEEKYIKPEKAYREQKLKQIKQKKKSYSLNDIVDHEKKYEQLRKKQNERKSNEKEMYLKSLKINTKEHYKGSIHKYVEEIDRANRQKNIAIYQLGKNRMQRMVDYANQVKQEHKPKVDETKKSELLKLLEFEHMKKNKMKKKYRPVMNSDGEDIGLESYYEEHGQKNRYKEGNKFMEQGNLKRKKNISHSVDVSVETSQKQESSENVKLLGKNSGIIREKGAAQKQIWKLRSKQMGEMSSGLSSPKQFEQVKVNFENLDRKAADKQALMKHAKLSVEQFIEQKGALDEFYLESIKNKMRLLE